MSTEAADSGREIHRPAMILAVIATVGLGAQGVNGPVLAIVALVAGVLFWSYVARKAWGWLR